MALKIRLRPQGRKNRRNYRLVVTESTAPRNGKYVEGVGFYDPCHQGQAVELTLKEERIRHWLEQGATLTEKAHALVKRGAPALLRERAELQQAKQAKK